MTTRHTFRMSIWSVLRPAALFVAVLGFLIAIGVGETHTAYAQPVLETDGGCEPESVRPDEPVLMTCTMSVTNTGDETATDLVAMLLPADGCSIPFPTLIDLTRDGELQDVSPFQLSFDIGDLAPGEAVESVMRLAVTNYDTGPAGGAITVVSRDDPSVTATGESCWDVAEDADAPPTNLAITKTLVTEFEYPDYQPYPTPPPAPDDGQPVPIVPPPGQGYPEEAEFEILISNVGGVEIDSVTILDVPTGMAVLVDSDPPANGVDALGRPTWDLSAFGLSSLPSDGRLRILATLGPPDEGYCSYADDVLVVTATPSGGGPEDYVAFLTGRFPSAIAAMATTLTTTAGSTRL